MDRALDDYRQAAAHAGFHWQEQTTILADQADLLFKISGGVVFGDFFERRHTPDTTLIASAQRCLRTDGWMKIGQSGKHHLAFDMLGHFSFYSASEYPTKEHMISFAWSYLTHTLKLPKARLTTTVHPRDQISQQVLQQLDIPYVLCAKNIDKRSVQGKSGVRVEFLWEWHQPCSTDCHALCPCGRCVELWNLVFTQFDSPEPFGPPLAAIAADSGMSLDRLWSAIDDVPNNYLNTLWRAPVSSLSAASGLPSDSCTVFRLADLGRAVCALTQAGLLPGNKGASYVLRKIMRDAFVLLRSTHLPPGEYAAICNGYWGYGMETTQLQDVVILERQRFETSIKAGLKACRKLLQRQSGILSNDDVQFLLDTHGLPTPIALEEIAAWKG